jgi:hypothetical protein
MGEWCCKRCGGTELGWRFYRLRNESGGEICSRPNLADVQRLRREHAWAKGSKPLTISIARWESSAHNSGVARVRRGDDDHEHRRERGQASACTLVRHSRAALWACA